MSAADPAVGTPPVDPAEGEGRNGTAGARSVGEGRGGAPDRPAVVGARSAGEDGWRKAGAALVVAGRGDARGKVEARVRRGLAGGG